MSFKKQYIEWEVPDSKVQVGIPVGFEIELSQNSNFRPATIKLTTFEEGHEPYCAKFYYSLDGTTWNIYPYGELGYTFYSAFRMRLELNVNDSGYIIVYSNGVVYKLSIDGVRINDSFAINVGEILDIDMSSRSNVLYLAGESTIYRIKTNTVLQPFDNSININGENALGIAVDESRSSFWQIGRDFLCLKDLKGEEIFCLPIPEHIDVDYSSSSSSSLDSSSSSSSSFGYSSSSSSSSSEGYSSSSSSSSSSSIDSSSSSSSISAYYKVTNIDSNVDFGGLYYYDGVANGHPYYKHKSKIQYLFQQAAATFGYLAFSIPPTPTPAWFFYHAQTPASENLAGIYTGNGPFTGTCLVEEAFGNESSSSSSLI